MPRTLADVVARIPGLAGWEASRQQNEERELNDVRQAHTLMSIIGAAREQQQKQAAFQQQEKYRAAMGALPADATEDQMLTAARPFMGAGDLAKMITSSQDRRATMDATREQRQANLQYQYANLERMERADRERADNAAVATAERAEAARRADETRRLMMGVMERLKSEGQNRPHAVVGVDANGNQTINWARPGDGPQTFQTRPPSLTTSGNQQALALRREYNANPEVKLANSLEPRVAPMAQYVAEVGTGMGNAVGDAELVKLWLMTTHPKGDQISNLDYRTIEKMPDLWGRVKNLTGNFVFGKTLDADTRTSMWRSISEKWKATDGARKKVRADVLGRGRSMSIGEDLIFAPTQE